MMLHLYKLQAGCPQSAALLPVLFVLFCGLGGMGSVRAGNLGTELALYLPLDGDSRDRSFQQVDLEVEGNPASSTDAATGQSLHFDGNADQLQVMPWKPETVLADRTNLSVSLWFKADSDTANEKRVLFDDTGSRGKQDGLSARVNWAISPSKLQATCSRDGKRVSLGVDFSDTTSWHHLVVRKEGDRFAMFLNGVKVAEETNVDTASASTVNAGVGVSFLGRIDEVRLYRRVLSDQEVVDLGTASSLTSAQIWRGHYFGETENTGAAADDQDADGDHSVNIWERATGTSPTQSSSVSLPEVGMTELSGSQYLSIRYQRLTGGAGITGVDYTQDGLTWRVQTRETLLTGNWRGGSAEVEQVGTPVDNGDGTETVTVRRKVDTETDPVSFLRVGVEP